MRVAILGGGTIARLVLRRSGAGGLPGVEPVALWGRGPGSRAHALAREFGLSYSATRAEILALGPEVVLEAASHEAVREHLVALLGSGVSVIVLSAGALFDDALRRGAEDAARASGAKLLVPSGGIGGLDALKASCAAGVDEVTIEVAKPPAAWKDIPYVDALGMDLARTDRRTVLFEGTAREGVPHFPQNVNIAAVLALAGIGFERTRLRVVADPALARNTHTIRARGACGRFEMVLENVPAPENPKTSWLACHSAIAALRELASPVRYGT